MEIVLLLETAICDMLCVLVICVITVSMKKVVLYPSSFLANFLLRLYSVTMKWKHLVVLGVWQLYNFVYAYSHLTSEALNLWLLVLLSCLTLDQCTYVTVNWHADAYITSIQVLSRVNNCALINSASIELHLRYSSLLSHDLAHMMHLPSGNKATALFLVRSTNIISVL